MCGSTVSGFMGCAGWRGLELTPGLSFLEDTGLQRFGSKRASVGLLALHPSCPGGCKIDTECGDMQAALVRTVAKRDFRSLIDKQ